jgi:hypothetical protein
MTIERPMFPPCADERCQIIQFSAAARVSPKRHVSDAAIVAAVDRVLIERRERPPHRRHRRNPLRKQYQTLELAIVEANRDQHHPERLQYIRRGVEAARILAEELARIADRLGA